MCCRDYTDDVKDSRKKDKPIYVPAGLFDLLNQTRLISISRSMGNAISV